MLGRLGVIEPRQSLFPALVLVERLLLAEVVGLSLQVVEKAAHNCVQAVKLKHAQIGQRLTHLVVRVVFALHCTLQIVLVEDIRGWGQGLGITPTDRLEVVVNHLELIIAFNVAVLSESRVVFYGDAS